MEGLRPVIAQLDGVLQNMTVGKAQLCTWQLPLEPAVALLQVPQASEPKLPYPRAHLQLKVVVGMLAAVT